MEAVYGEPARKPTLFLGVDDAVGTQVAEARALVASRLQTKVLSLSDRAFDDARLPFTPVDPDSGEPGVAIALGRFTLERDDRLRVTASFVRGSGTKQGCTEFFLSRAAGAWVIVEQRNANSPDCPLIAQASANYDAVVSRARAGDCPGLWARIGSCGTWLVVIVSRIDSYKEWYFDPDTRLLVAEYVYDPMSGVDAWTFGYADCGNNEFVEAELRVCDNPL